MLKYGNLQNSISGNSKSLIPRNLTYRQKELFKTKISSDEIIPIIDEQIKQSSTNTFSSINSNQIFTDNIYKKTLEDTNDEYININNPVSINNSTFSYNFNQNTVFTSDSIIINIPSVTIKSSSIIYDNIMDGSNYPIYIYNINNNPIEKKYYYRILQNTTLKNIYFNNIINNTNDITFNGMLMGKNINTNEIFSSIIEGYSYTNNNNKIIFLNSRLLSQSNDFWKINSYQLSNNNLEIELLTPSNSNIQWSITLTVLIS